MGWPEGSCQARLQQQGCGPPGSQKVRRRPGEIPPPRARADLSLTHTSSCSSSAHILTQRGRMRPLTRAICTSQVDLNASFGGPAAAADANASFLGGALSKLVIA